MGIKKTGILLLSMTVLVTAGFVSNQAFAGFPSAGSNPSAPGPQFIINENGFSGVVNLDQESIGACDPVSSCPPIVKNIDPTEQPPSSPPNPPAGGITIHEDWINAGSIDWVDWHEKIIPLPQGTGGWIFTSVQISDCVGPMTNKDSSISTDGTEVWLNFPPVTNGERLCIWKDVVFDPTFGVQPGGPPIRSTPEPGLLQIFEWPTIRTMAVGGDIIPLDSTMVLVAGTQYTAAWMIPVLVSAIGIGIVIARKF